MAVDLVDLIEPLRREVNPPGADLFPAATDEVWRGILANAFWEIRLYGLLERFEENAAARGGPPDRGPGIVTPIGAPDGYDAPDGVSAADLGRDLQQLIVLWAAWAVVSNRMSTLNSVFRARAGSVEYETQNAASVLKAALDQLRARIDNVLNAVGQQGATSVVAIDAVIARTYALASGDQWWVR